MIFVEPGPRPPIRGVISMNDSAAPVCTTERCVSATKDRFATHFPTLRAREGSSGTAASTMEMISVSIIFVACSNASEISASATTANFQSSPPPRTVVKSGRSPPRSPIITLFTPPRDRL